MKRYSSKLLLLLLAMGCSLTMTACSLFPDKKDEGVPLATPSISEVIEVSEDYFSSVFPYEKNQTRGLVSTGRRIGFTHLELGLLEIARETFNPDEYLFQEGQLISRSQVEAWLSLDSKHPEGLNSEQNPNLVAHILEHNYLNMERELAGIVIGISLSPDYKDETGADKEYTRDELRSKGQQVASVIVQKVRHENQQIPMVVALYQIPSRSNSLVPGNFILSGTVNASDSTISKWLPIDEEYYLFPSSALEKDHSQISFQFDKLRKQIQEFFGEFIGLTGNGRFMDGELRELTLTATAEYDSRTEVLQFTQYAAALLEQLFDDNVHINLYVQSINQPLSIYVRPNSGPSYMHIYRK